MGRYSSDGYKSCKRVAYIFAGVIMRFSRASGGEFELSTPLHFSLSSLSSNTTVIDNVISPRGDQGIQAWTLRTILFPRDRAKRAEAARGAKRLVSTHRYLLSYTVSAAVSRRAPGIRVLLSRVV